MCAILESLSILLLRASRSVYYFVIYCSSLTHANAFENHESSNGEEPLLKTPPSSTPPPPPVLGYAVAAAAAQQNHVDSAPDSPPPSAASSRLVNHVTSMATTMPSSLSRPSSLAGNGTEQSAQQSMNSNHFPGNCFIIGMVLIGQINLRVLLYVIRIF